MDNNEQYYLVIYCNDGTIHLWPAVDKEECLQKLEDMLTYEKVKKVYKDATIIKRDMSNYKDGYIFGQKEYVSRIGVRILK